METALWWLRRDLRLADDQALAAALDEAGSVVPVFVLDPHILDSGRVAPVRLAFLLDGLRHLDVSLRARGSRLVIRRGDPADVIPALVAETSAGAVWAEEDHTPYSRARDERVARRAPLRLVGGRLVHAPGTVLKADGEPYVVFTPFSRAWKTLPQPAPSALLSPPERIPTPAGVDGLPIPEAPACPASVSFSSGEAHAHEMLRAFTQGDGAPIYDYRDRRDRVDLDATSRLSPYLHLGMVSSRAAVSAARQAIESAPNADSRAGAETWLNELIWREFYTHVLYHFPHVVDESFRADLRSVPWRNDADEFAAWCAGRTGYPIVDAAMRQLAASGWMHNRARMVVASFLTKDLLIDWRWGERFFMQHLVDGDTAANNGGWQWAAGTGTDAAPYFRIFNPVLQGERHDPSGVHVRRWVPELTDVPDRYLHQPWKMDADEQRRAGCRIGRDYPTPIVDHRRARERTLAAYRRARDREE